MPERYDGNHKDDYGHFTVFRRSKRWWFVWYRNRHRPADRQCVGEYGPFNLAKDAYDAAVLWRSKPYEVFSVWMRERRVFHIEQPDT